MSPMTKAGPAGTATGLSARQRVLPEMAEVPGGQLWHWVEPVIAEKALLGQALH